LKVIPLFLAFSSATFGICGASLGSSASAKLIVLVVVAIWDENLVIICWSYNKNYIFEHVADKIFP